MRAPVPEAFTRSGQVRGIAPRLCSTATTLHSLRVRVNTCPAVMQTVQVPDVSAGITHRCLQYAHLAPLTCSTK